MRALTVALVLSIAIRAHAHALFQPRPISSAIAGPTDPHVAAIFYNPGALGYLRGFHLWIDGGPRFQAGSVKLEAEGARAAGSTSISATDFDGFVGLTWDLFTDRATLGIATYAPMVELSSFPGSSVARYQEIDQRMAVLEQTLAASYKLTNRVSVGAAVNFGQVWLDYRYLRDAAPFGGSAYLNQPQALCQDPAGNPQPCGLDNPQAAQEVRLRGFGWGVGFSLGILARPIDRLWLALSYTSHLFGTGTNTNDIVLYDSTGGRVRPAPGQTSACDPCTGNDQISVAVPDMIQLGLRLELTSRVDLEASARWIHYGARAQLAVKLQGGALGTLATNQATTILSEYNLDRGLKDTGLVEVSARFRLGNLRLSPSFTYESPAVERSAVSAAAIDGHKFDVALTAEWKPHKRVTLGAHVGVTAYALSTVHSRFDSLAAASCVDSGYSLDACHKVIEGYALPSASGEYQPVTAHFGGAFGLDF